MINKDDAHPPGTIVEFEIRRDTTRKDAYEARITYLLDGYSSRTSDGVIGLPDQLGEQIRVLLQNHLDNRGKR